MADGARRTLHRGLAAAVLLMAAAACAPATPAERIDFRQAGPEPPAAPIPSPRPNTIRMAVAPVISPRETFNFNYRDLADYLGARLDMSAELVPGKSYAEINDLVRTGDVTLAFVCTNPYLQGRDDFGMEALVVPEVNGATLYYSYLITRTDAPFRSLADLRGHTFAFSDPLSNSGRLAPVYQLALRGETPDSFFSRYTFTQAHDNSIKAVAQGLVDAAAVDSLVFDYWVRTGSEYARKTKVIDQWGPFGINPVVVHPRLDADLKARLRAALLAMHEDARGAAILQSLLIDRFVVPDDRVYDSVRTMRAYMASARLGG